MRGCEQVMELVAAEGVVGIVRAGGPREALSLVESLTGAGLRVVEVAMTTPGALDVITEAAGTGLIGAGTVRTLAHARDAVAAGAGFLVSPNLDTDVVRYAAAHDIACIPGCATPTEMITAMAAGAGAVKVFPAHLWSPAAIRGLLQALPDLPCVPTGGIDPATAPDWIAAGAVAVGLGSSLAGTQAHLHVGDLRRRIARAREPASA